MKIILSDDLILCGEGRLISVFVRLQFSKANWSLVPDSCSALRVLMSYPEQPGLRHTLSDTAGSGMSGQVILP